MRLSNGIRRIEDAVGFVAGSVARGTKNYAHNVRIEYRARQMAALEDNLRRSIEKFQKLSPAKKAAHIFDQMEVERRLAELRAQRKDV